MLVSKNVHVARAIHSDGAILLSHVIIALVAISCVRCSWSQVSFSCYSRPLSHTGHALLFKKSKYDFKKCTNITYVVYMINHSKQFPTGVTILDELIMNEELKIKLWNCHHTAVYSLGRSVSVYVYLEYTLFLTKYPHYSFSLVYGLSLNIYNHPCLYPVCI